MKQYKKHHLLILITPLLLILLFPLLVANSSSPQAISQSREPTALAPDDALPFELQEVVEQASHIPVPLSSDSLQVDSSAHRALFTPQWWVFTPKVKGELKPELSFSYRLSSISSGSRLLYQQGESSPPPTSSENRVSYYRGEGITERYLATSQGIEQQFLLERPLAVEGDLIVRGKITTDLLPNTSDSTKEIEFQSEGRTIIHYGAARVEDTQGECINNLPISIEGDELCLVVNGEWLREASYPVLIDPLVSSYTAIGVAADFQREPRVAFNRDDDTYLVVWEDFRDGIKYHIYGQRVDADGHLLGSNIQIQAVRNDSRYPDVAYNYYNNNWLVVWQEFYSEPSPGDWDIVSKAVASDGTVWSLKGVAPYIGSNQKCPRVAYNSTDRNFCVVWEDDIDYATNDWEVYSRLVAGDGTPIGSPYALSGYSTDQLSPAIAYLPSVSGYLVVWEDYLDSANTQCDIVCKRVHKDGLPLTSTGSWVVHTSEIQCRPEVAVNTTDKNFLVVWEDYRSGSHWDIYGQRMSSDDSPVKVGSEISICTLIENQQVPTVCYSPTYNRYLVAWSDERNDPGVSADIYGQLVNSDGTLEGINVKLSSQDGVNEVYPHLTWNSCHNNCFFLVWEDNRYDSTYGYDIFGRRVGYQSAIVTGMGFGGKSWYKVFDIYKYRYQCVRAFGAVNPYGEIDVRVADLNQDGNPEVAVAQGSGGKSWIKIFNYDSTIFGSLKCFGASNIGGQVHLAVGDFDDDPGDMEIAVATGIDGVSRVKVFKTNGTLLTSFKAYGAFNTQGEVYLAAVDFDGDGKDEIITGTGIGGNSLVKIFDKDGTFLSSFYAFGSGNTQGSIHLAAGNFDDIIADKEIAVATGQGGTNTVKIFEQNGTLITSFLAFGSADNPNGSVHLGAVKIGAFDDMIDEILCGHGYGGNSWVQLFEYTGKKVWSYFRAFGDANANGEVYVSGCLSH